MVFCSGRSKTSLKWINWFPRSVTSKQACHTSGLRLAGTGCPLQMAYISDAEGASASNRAVSSSKILKKLKN